MVWICWTVILIGGKAVNANPALSEAAEEFRLPRKAFILTFFPSVPVIILKEVL